MDSDYLFGIFKLLLHINSKELLAQAYAMLAKFDTTLTSHLGFPDPKYFIFFTFDFKCTQWRLLQKRLYYVGFLVWLFGFFYIERTVGHHSLHFLFIITTHIKSVNKKNIKHT